MVDFYEIYIVRWRFYLTFWTYSHVKDTEIDNEVFKKKITSNC